jgi:hypothetical protein
MQETLTRMREIEMSNKAQEAVKLLRDDNLLWSNDFDLVRHKIADVIEEANTITHPVILATIRDLCHHITSPVVLEKPNA